MNLILTVKKKEIDNVYTFIFKSDKNLKFKPGQYMIYRLPHEAPDRRKDKRYFTISAAPFESVIKITTRIAKKEGSSFKKALFGLRRGHSIYARGPSGNFVLKNPQRPAVFIAGGIGITPFRSMLLDLVHHQVPFDICLLYAIGDTKDIVFQKELESMAEENLGLRFYYVVHPKRIDEETIERYVPDYLRRVFYVSGPEPMVEEFEKMLEKMGILRRNIKRDYFPGYDWP
jgi:ferredoxin-NADP reductase